MGFLTLSFILALTLQLCLFFLSRENKRHLNNSRNNGWYVVRYGYLKNANFLLTLSSFNYRFRNTGFCSEKLWFTSYVGDQVFSSPELKAQMSFSDHLSSVVCPSVHPYVYKLFTFSSSSSEPLGQFLPNSWVKGIQVCSNEAPRPSRMVDNDEILTIH